MPHTNRALACGLASVLAVSAPAALLAPQQTRPASTGSLHVEHEIFLAGGTRHSLAWSPDGKLLAAGGSRGDMIVVDAETGSLRATLDASDLAIGCVRFSPDGRRVAALGRGLSVWGVDGRLLARSPARPGTRFAWSADGAHVACVLDDSGAGLLRSSDLGVVTRLRLAGVGAADAVAFTADGSRLAVGRPGATYVFALATGEIVDVLPEAVRVAGLAERDDGGLARLDDATRAGLPEGSAPAATRPDGRRWARAHAGAIEVWDGERIVSSLAAQNRREPEDVVLTSDGRFVIESGRDRPIEAIDTRTGSRSRWPELPQGKPLHYHAGPELALLRAVSTGAGVASVLELWSTSARGEGRAASLSRSIPLGAAAGGSWPHEHARLDASGRYCVLGQRVFDLLDAKAPRLDRSGGTEDALYAFPDRVVLALERTRSCLGGGIGTVRLLAPDGAEVAECSAGGFPVCIDRSPDGRSIALVTCIDFFLTSACVLGPDLARRVDLGMSWRGLSWLDDQTLVGARDERDPWRTDSNVHPCLALLDAETGAVRARLDLPAEPRALHVDRASRRLLATLADRILVVR